MIMVFVFQKPNFEKSRSWSESQKVKYIELELEAGRCTAWSKQATLAVKAAWALVQILVGNLAARIRNPPILYIEQL